MRTHARAVVIGGGVVGVSTLYHLAKKGWTDSVLVERKELTSGSTWHAAGLLPLFNLSYSVGQIHKYSVALYQTLEKESGLDVGLRQVSNIRLARTRDRMDEYHYYAGVAATIARHQRAEPLRAFIPGIDEDRMGRRSRSMAFGPGDRLLQVPSDFHGRGALVVFLEAHPFLQI